ncbi:hypothetical protein PLIIFM63780_001597 [Purpureocillium lilacinum]|nr:hypothetical protein PLIIFM63780_001597 [Purpureocillium lilacinum]
MYVSRAVCWRCASRMRLAVTTSAAAAVAVASPRLSSTAADASPDAATGTRTRDTEPRRQQQQHVSSAGSHQQHARRRPSHQRSAKASQQSAVALFNDVVKKAPQASSPPSASSPSTSSLQQQQNHKPATALGEWEIAAKMKELAEQKALDPRDRLRLFRADIWPHVRELRGQMPRHLYMATTQFLARACDAAADAGHTGASGPGVGVELSAMCARIGKWDLDVRNELVLSLCHSLVHTKHSSAERAAILEELVDLWKHISQLRRRSQGHHAPLQFVLPTPAEAFGGEDAGQQQQQQRSSSNMNPTTKALSSIFIQFRLEQARELVPGLLATVAVLSDPRLARQGSQVKAAPLLNLVAQAFQRQGNPDQAYIEEVFRNKIRFPSSKLDELEAYILKQWPHAEAMLSNAAASWRYALEGSKGSGPSSGLATFHRQLRAAYRARNTGAVVSIWQDLKTRLAQKPDLARQMREDPEFLDFWIFVWCAVRRPAKLQETLDLMRETGVRPSVKTYTAMMHGWKMCKDGDKIAALWDKLVESGLRLDAVIWTERISGLIESGRPQAGVQALAEMMALWKQALAKKGGDAVAAAASAIQPSIEVVNAAFKGLIRLDLKAANEVLAWAGREGIEPNIRTYNILLRESFRGNATPDDDVQSLLRAMKRQGVEPDAATFTIILEEVLGVMDNTSAAEQVHAVRQVLADIEAAGLRPNLETYGKMLYAVASLANGGADEAVAAVQEHMRAAGFSATPHMVTILIERALAREASSSSSSSSTPSSASSGAAASASAQVQALLREHNLTHVGQGDQTLWERVMSAHAAAGDTPAAMRVFADLARAGRPVTSLPCLTDLLRALLAAERADDAREVVRVVLAHKVRRAAAEGGSAAGSGGASASASGAQDASGDAHVTVDAGSGGFNSEAARDARYWRHHFWYMARENGLLNWDEVPLELQTRLRGQGSN